MLSFPDPRYRTSAVTYGEDDCHSHLLSSLLQSLKATGFFFKWTVFEEMTERSEREVVELEVSENVSAWNEGQKPATERPPDRWALFALQ